MQCFLLREVKGHSTVFARFEISRSNKQLRPIAANWTCKKCLTVFMEKSPPELVDPMSLQFILTKEINQRYFTTTKPKQNAK